MLFYRSCHLAATALDAPIRKIIHCDCDCFYASVEMRDQPALRGQPVAVGGRADQRGVVAACNYEARRFGIHSAMAMGQALRRCPALVVLPVAMEKYRRASRQIPVADSLTWIDRSGMRKK